MSRVAVVMPVRNAESTVEAAVRSILDQTREAFEFVIVDHASSDGTPALLRNLAESDPRIRLFRCEGSFVEAANLAWRKSTADLIARMDSDDVADPRRLELQIDYLESHPRLAACGSRVRIVKREADGAVGPADGGYQRYEEWVNSVLTPESIRRERFVDSPLPNPTAMIRREILESLGGYQDPSWAEDYDFWLRLLAAGHELGKVDEVLLDWFDGPERSTRTIERYELSRFQEAKAEFLSLLPAVRSLGVTLCGAGPIGKEMAGFLRERDIRVSAFCEVNERQIGNRIAGIPVIGSDSLADLRGSTILLSAVGQPGARDRIRDLVEASGFREGEDFFCVA